MVVGWSKVSLKLTHKGQVLEVWWWWTQSDQPYGVTGLKLKEQSTQSNRRVGRYAGIRFFNVSDHMSAIFYMEKADYMGAITSYQWYDSWCRHTVEIWGVT